LSYKWAPRIKTKGESMARSRKPREGVQEPPRDLSDFLQRALERMKGTEFDSETSAGIIVAPARDWPPESELTVLAEGRIIGLIGVSFHLTKFGIGPGIYSMRLYRTKFGTWQVAFLNESNQSVSNTPAEITETLEYHERPIASITFSSPGVVICVDHICIEV
jgi:hypothetical protein